ncbi:MAG: sulfite exporter TauE/SafE family protein [Roseburia sp.]|nr:sulfite exporter TauE/SafE family protein [Roseburia sp.]
MLWWIVAVLCAYFVKGLCGFANTLVLSTILSFGTDTINITPVDLLLSVPTNGIMAWKERKNLDWGMCIPLTLLLLAGSIPGVLFLKNAESDLVKIIFGFVVIYIGVDSLLHEREYKGRPSKIKLYLIGIISGIICGIYGVGALLSAYVSRNTKDSHSFKGNICFVFFAENTFRAILYICCGIITLETATKSLMLIPVMLIGLWAGMASSNFLNEKIVKKIVIIMLIVSGAALVINNL